MKKINKHSSYLEKRVRERVTNVVKLFEEVKTGKCAKIPKGNAN